MERRIEEYLKKSCNNYVNAYKNHYGYGDVVGCGDINGTGYGYGLMYNQEDNGENILLYNGHSVYSIDGYLLYITNIRSPWAMGKIIKNDLTTQDCYLGKINDNIIVGTNLHDIMDELRIKISKKNNNIDDIVQAFVFAHPNYEKEYDWGEMVTWHSLDKTSCADGRKKFSNFANKSNTSKVTPKELVEIMKKFDLTEKYAIKMEKLYIEKKIG